MSECVSETLLLGIHRSSDSPW